MAGSDVRRAVQDALRARDVERATRLADAHSEPWYRCQALALVAAVMPESRERSPVLARAFAAAVETKVPNRIVTVSAWPLRVLEQYGETRKVSREVARLLTIITAEPHPIRRMDALSMLCGAVRSEPTASLLDRELMAAALAGHGWKRDALLAGRALAALDAGDGARALSLLQAIELARTRRRLARDLVERGMKIVGVELSNLDERRRVRAELSALQRDAADLYAEWNASPDASANADLTRRMNELTARQRELEAELARARTTRERANANARTRTRTPTPT